MGPGAAAIAARRLIEAGATSLVSWGLAGGLDPDLPAGTVCLPREVIAEDGSRLATAGSWRETLAAALEHSPPLGHPPGSGSLITVAQAIDTADAKSAVRRETGACAVDMESSAIAQVARVHGVPFIAVRVIVDTAGDSLPPAVTGATRAGQVRLMRLMVGLIRSPVEVASLLRLARRYRAALRALKTVARLGPLQPPLPSRVPV